jgi:hypothetical protein
MSFCHRNHFFVFRNEHAQTTNFRSKTHGWGGFTQFRSHVTRSENGCRGAYKARVFANGTISSFSATNMLGPKLMFGVVLRNFVAARHPFLKWLSGCTRSTSFGHRNHFFVSCYEHAQSTTLGPKLMFGVVSRNYVAAHHPFRKRVSGCIQSTSFCHQNYFFVFRNEHAQTTTLGPKLMFVRFRAISLPTSPIPKTGVGVHTKHEFLPPEPFIRFSQ